MPKATKAPWKRVLWTAADVRLLKSQARRRPVGEIAKQLHRSEAAVRYKAATLKISLALRHR